MHLFSLFVIVNESYSFFSKVHAGFLSLFFVCLFWEGSCFCFVWVFCQCHVDKSVYVEFSTDKAVQNPESEERLGDTAEGDEYASRKNGGYIPSSSVLPSAMT